MTHPNTVAASLASVAGFVDAIGYITLHGLFVAHMSGNSVRFGVGAGHGGVGAVAPAGVAVLLFVGGVAAGTVAAELAARRRVHSVAAIVLAIQAALIAAFMVDGSNGGGFYTLAALAVVSMGMQTSALRQLSGRTISTTYVTGVLTSLTQEIMNYLFWLCDGAHRDTRRSFLTRVLGLGSRGDSRSRILLLGAVWIAYAGGATLGSYLDGQVRLWALLVPLGVLALAIARDLVHPLTL